MKIWKLVMALTVSMLVAAGCGKEPNPGWDEPLALEGPLVMQEAVVYLDQSFEELVILRTGEDASLTVDRRATGAGPEQLTMSADGRSLYVINRQDQSLSVFEIGSGSVGQNTIELGSVYDRMTIDPHGEFLLLSNSGEAAGEVIQNINEVGIVDLRGGEPSLTVTTLPTRADNIELMDPFEMEGESQRIAVALATNRLTILDLHAELRINRVRSVPLTTSQADNVEPTSVVFDPPTEARPNVASLFVLDNRADDVTQLDMQPPAGESERKFQLTINQLPAGQSPGEIAVLELESSSGTKVKRLLALDSQRPEFTLVDVNSGELATFELPMNAAADGMEVYRIAGPGQSSPETRVLVYSHSAPLMAVVRPGQIAVGSETPTLGQAVVDMRLSANPSQMVMEGGTDPNRAVVLHAGGSDGLSVINLENNENWWLPGQNPSQIVFDGSFGYGIFHNSSHLVRLDLETGQPTVFDLPARGRSLYLSPDNESVLVRHDGQSGRFTVLERTAMTPENGRLYEQVFLEGALEYEVSDEE